MLRGFGKNLGVENSLLCPHNSAVPDRLDKQDVQNIFCFKKTFWSNLTLPYRIRKLSEQYEFDLIHVHDSHGHTYLWLSYLCFEDIPPGIVHRRVDFQNSWLSRHKYNHPSILRFICVSKAIGKVLSEIVSAQERVNVVYSGVDLNPLQIKTRNKKGLKALFGISEETLIIANIASIAPHKDVICFVKTAEYLNEISDMKFKFLWIGSDGGHQARLQKLINQSKIKDLFSLTGFLENPSSYLDEIDLLLITSKEEGLNTTVLDAFAHRVPVVATGAGGLKEIAIHKETALTSKIGNHKGLAEHIHTFLNDSTLSINILERAHKFVQSFSKDAMTKQIHTIYKSCLNELN